MKDLYDITATQALDGIIDKVLADNPDMSRKMAKKLVINALLYNCVIDEVLGQVNFLLGKENIYE